MQATHIECIKSCCAVIDRNKIRTQKFYQKREKLPMDFGLAYSKRKIISVEE